MGNRYPVAESICRRIYRPPMAVKYSALHLDRYLTIVGSVRYIERPGGLIEPDFTSYGRSQFRFQFLCTVESFVRVGSAAFPGILQNHKWCS
jgi:hypothetical protein